MARNLAIVVGINQYPLLDQPLRYAEQDAIAMRDYLKNEAGFEPVYLFSDNAPAAGDKTAQPFRNNLLMVLDQVAAKVRLQESDSLWFFFSGHGARQAEQDYLLLSDSYLGNLQETAISTDRIIRSLRQCGAGNLILILDACRNRVRDAGKGIGSQTVELAKQEGVISLFSCRPSQMSFEIAALNQGAFTCALLEALRGDCQPHSTTVEQLDRYLLKRVPELNRQHNQPAQEPYLIAEPARKYHQILLPSNVAPIPSAPAPPAPTTQDTVDRLKSEAFHATYVVKDLDRAKQLWRRVNEFATNPEDRKLAVDRIEEIAQKQRDQNPPLSTDSGNQTTDEAPKAASPSPVEPAYRREEVRQPPNPQLTTPPPNETKELTTPDIWGWLSATTQPAPKAVSPPSTKAASQRIEVPRSSTPQPTPQSLPSRPQNRAIPWIRIIVATLIFAPVGFLLTVAAAPFWVWAGSVFVALVVALALDLSVALDMAGAGFGAEIVAGCGVVSVVVVVAVSGTGAVVGLGAWVWAGVGAGGGAWAVAGEKLLESFSHLHTFWILITTSWLGLGLGWLGYWVFQQVSGR